MRLLRFWTWAGWRFGLMVVVTRLDLDAPRLSVSWKWCLLFVFSAKSLQVKTKQYRKTVDWVTGSKKNNVWKQTQWHRKTNRSWGVVFCLSQVAVLVKSTKLWLTACSQAFQEEKKSYMNPPSKRWQITWNTLLQLLKSRTQLEVLLFSIPLKGVHYSVTCL